MEWNPGQIGRRWWKASTLNDLSATSERLEELFGDDHENANLVSSLCQDGMHAVVIDMDHRARLVPSSTAGHSHLYIDELLTWREYRAFLSGMYRSGLIDASVFWRSLDREATYVRPPGVSKTAEEAARGAIDAAPDPVAAARALRRVKWRVLRRWPLWWVRELVAATKR